MRTVGWLAAAGLRHRPMPWLLLALGVALAVAFPVLAAGLRHEAGTAAVAGTLDALPAYERTVLATTFVNLRGGVTAPAAEQTVRDGFAAAGLRGVTGVLAYRPVAAGGVATSVVAVDGLAYHVRLTAGRLPTACRPARCEVLAVSLPGVSGVDAAQAESDLGLVVTGAAELIDQRLTGSGLVATDRALLLGGDRDALGRLDALQMFGRTRAWLGTLDGRTVAAAGVGPFAAELRRLGESVDLAQASPLNITWPQEQVAAAAARADAAGGRFTVLGAGAGALQLGFCAVVAAGLRHRQQRVAGLLARRGAGPAQLVGVAGVQAAAAVLTGSLTGLLAAVAVVAARAPAAGADPVAAGLAALGTTWAVVTGLAVAAVVLVTAVVSWSADGGRTGRWLLWSGLAGATGVCVLTLAGSDGQPGVGLAGAAVVAYVLGVGLLATLGWPELIRRFGRRGRLTPISSARVVAVRRPLVPMVTAGFLAAAVTMSVFAAGYRQSLQQSAEDQAAYAVPLEATLAPSRRVAAPLDALDPAALTRAVPGAVVAPVVGTPVTLSGGTPRAEARTLTAVDVGTLTAMRRFAAVTGSALEPAELATRLRTNAPVEPTTGRATIPAGRHRLGLRADGYGPGVVIGLWLRTDGVTRRIDLAGSGPGLTADLSLATPAAVVAMELSQPGQQVTSRAHGTEGKTDRQLTAGRLSLGALQVDGRPLTTWTGWGSRTATVELAPDRRLRVDYRFGASRIVLAPVDTSPATRSPLPVAADPDTAAAAGSSGRLTLRIEGQNVPAVVVAVLDRFPGRGSQVLLSDRNALDAALDPIAPGNDFSQQVWVGAPSADVPALRGWLRSSPAAATTLTFRTEVEEALGADPVATRSLTLLTSAGVVALALAVVAAAIGVRADRAESAADQHALELAGSPPAVLRRRLWQRGWQVAAVGLPLGLAGGLLLSRLGVGLLLPVSGPVPLQPDLAVLPVVALSVLAAVAVLTATAIPVLTAYRERWSAAELELP